MIKKLILRLLITAVGLTSIIYLIPGVVFQGGLIDLLKMVGVLVITNLMLKPLLKIFALPVEVATLGLFGLILNALVLWFLARWITTFRITSFWFSGITGGVLLIAPVEIHAFFTAIISSFVLAVVSTVLYWLTK